MRHTHFSPLVQCVLRCSTCHLMARPEKRSAQRRRRQCSSDSSGRCLKQYQASRLEWPFVLPVGGKHRLGRLFLVAFVVRAKRRCVPFLGSRKEKKAKLNVNRKKASTKMLRLVLFWRKRWTRRVGQAKITKIASSIRKRSQDGTAVSVCGSVRLPVYAHTELTRTQASWPSLANGRQTDRQWQQMK